MTFRLPTVGHQTPEHSCGGDCSSCVCAPSSSEKLKDAVSTTRAYLREHARERPVFVGFSGGKDSSAALAVILLAIKGLRRKPSEVVCLYADTGVEIPLARRRVERVFRRLKQPDGVGVRGRMIRPPLANRYFVKVIGRGYPPPTNKFRWCTDRLRIAPVAEALDEYPGEKILVLGTRWEESTERRRAMERYALDDSGRRFRHSDRKEVEIFSPIAHFTTNDVWSLLLSGSTPELVGGKEAFELYQKAGASFGGECPILPDRNAPGCGAGRFGCWTCTVVRRDRAMETLVENGFERMAPLLRWRDWLLRSRDLPSNRWTRRRNGARGPGPLTVGFRRRLLQRLLEAESASGIRLIEKREVSAIYDLWRLDGART